MNNAYHIDVISSRQVALERLRPSLAARLSAILAFQLQFCDSHPDAWKGTERRIYESKRWSEKQRFRKFYSNPATRKLITALQLALPYVVIESATEILRLAAMVLPPNEWPAICASRAIAQHTLWVTPNSGTGSMGLLKLLALAPFQDSATCSAIVRRLEVKPEHAVRWAAERLRLNPDVASRALAAAAAGELTFGKSWSASVVGAELAELWQVLPGLFVAASELESMRSVQH